MMIPLQIYLIFTISSIFLLLSVHARYVNSGRVISVTDPFYIAIVFYFLYYIISQLYRIDMDSFHESVYVLVAFIVLVSTIVLFYLTKNSAVKSTTSSFDGDLYKQGKVFMLAAIICLIVGYVFWYLNYVRLGDWSTIISDYNIRAKRNSNLRSMTGNLPYTHFMYIGYSYFLASLLFRGNSIKKSTILSLLLVSPLLLFYIIEGERTALIKYIISSFFLISFIKYKGFIALRKKHFISIALLILAMSIIGSLRGGIYHYVNTGDISQITEKIDDYDYGINLEMPVEFKSVNYTLNRTVNDIVNGEKEPLFGSSYIQSIPYLFPRSVYKVFDLTKESTIADKFGDMINEDIKPILKLLNLPEQGFGMSALAEAVANFHIAGMLIFPLLLISILNLWSYIAHSSKNVFALFLVLVLTPIFVFIHRTSFASTFSFFAYVSFISFIAYWMGSVLEKVLSIRRNK